MEALRRPVDELEMLVDKSVWPVDGTAVFTAIMESARLFVYLITAGI